MNVSLNLVGWLTIADGIVTVVSFAFLIVFFARGEPYGTLNDITSIFQVLLMAPALIFLLSALRQNNAAVAAIGAALGLVGILTTAVTQSLLVIGVIPFEKTVRPNMMGGGLIGVWLIITNFLARGTVTSSVVVPWIGMTAGIGYILLVIGFSLGGQNHRLFQFGGGLTVLTFPIWAIWLGILMISGRVTLAG